MPPDRPAPLTRFAPGLRQARLIGRAGRFTLHARGEPAGQPLLLHLPNSGRLETVLVPGSKIYYRPAPPQTRGAGRRPRVTVGRAVLAEVPAVGLATVDANLLAGAVAAGLRRSLFGFDGQHGVRQEVKVGDRRFDIELLDAAGQRAWLIEVKSVTLARDGVGLFPDAPTGRGAEHLRRLGEIAAAGGRTALIFAVGRRDASRLRPHVEVDPRFGQALRKAAERGLKVLVWRIDAAPDGLYAGPKLGVDWQ